MKPHANSHENDAFHHLYELYDVERAEEIEREHIDAYRKKYGHNPPGNV